MLEEIHIRNLALIKEAWLEFAPGMTVLTGETGAGKTVLLGGLKLLLGERADSTAVRSGADEALVEGRFVEDGVETVVRRRIGTDGRSRCTLDDEMVIVGALAERLGPLVDLHGQHEHQALLSAGTHVGYLDRWAGEAVAGALVAYRTAREAFAEAARSRDRIAARVAEAARDVDYLRFVVAEIERVAPQQGEDEALRARLPALQNAEKLSEAASEVASVLRGDAGALDRIAEAHSALSRVSGIDPALDLLDERLAEAAALIDDAGMSARSYRDAIEHDPDQIDATLTRLSELAGLTKKYGPSLDGVLERLDESHAALAIVDDGEGALSAVEASLASARDLLAEKARALDTARRAAAPGFVEALAGATRELAMDGARFEVSFSDLAFESWTSEGSTRVEFLFAPAPGQPGRPLSRVASGGEISRVMLALKGVLGGADRVLTLVFDEVDAGIGGATATAVGCRLAELALTHQVIVVTHLAQVAAYADKQLVVRKEIAADDAVTTVGVVEGEARVAEIARMLSGNDSAASRAHAAELLGEAATSAAVR